MLTRYKFSLLFFFINLCALNGYAQKAKFNDLIITANGDSLSAQIKPGWKYKNKTTVSYKVEGKSKFTIANPTEVSAYSHDNQLYRSVEIDGKALFLKANINGDVSFYETVDSKGEKTFYLKKRGEELQQIEHTNLRPYLSAYFNSCENERVKQKLKKSSYTTFRIANLVSEYNACRFPNKYVSVRYRPKLRLDLFFVAGIGSFNYQLTRTGAFPDSFSLTFQQFAPYFGVNFQIVSEHKLSAGLDINYSKFEYSNSSDDRLETSRLHFTPYLRHTLSQKLKLSARTGFSVNFVDFSNGSTFTPESAVAIGWLVGLDYQISHRLTAQADYDFQENGDPTLFNGRSEYKNFKLSLNYKIY